MFMYVAWPRLTAEYRYVRILTGSDADKVFHLMQLWMSNDAAAGPVLTRLLEDSSDPVTRAAAARYLERYPSEPAIVGLMAAARDRDQQVRTDAIASLGEVGDARTIALLRGLAAREKTLEASYAREALKRLAARGVAGER